MQKITPCLWFEKDAGEIAKFYTAIFNASQFKASQIENITTLENTPSGTASVGSVELLGYQFTILAAGPLFKFTPAVSFLVACKTMEEVDALWQKLSQGGTALMELGEYPFSKRYGWIQDRYGLSWQIMLTGVYEPKNRITTTLMFTGQVWGKAEEAVKFYASVFHKAQVGEIVRYAKGEGQPQEEGTVKHGAFTLEGQGFAAMDSAYDHNFTFNEAISFQVNCETQEEIDYYWGKLSASPEAEQCGWLKDQYGVSWQIVPTVLPRLLQDKNPDKVARVTEAFLKMKKLDIDALKRAYEGK